ncbi:MAG: shikimate kinase [Candidatus Omnitrophica bacterium]|nr:shikimate kinase [Candidatus Omnitrophota bacterium]MDD5355627.1 shikimate kinase [Candidatus Omnitrophota bacterium]
MKNIYIVGFMGTGKTSTGKELAARLKRGFLDLDGIIEEKEKMPIAQIFGQKGESYFRKLEKDLIKDVSSKEDLVVSCGGGAVAEADNLASLKKSGVIICLKADADTILKRTKGNLLRPLLNVDNPRERINELLKNREPFYSQSDHFLDTTGLSIGQTVDKIIEIIK